MSKQQVFTLQRNQQEQPHVKFVSQQSTINLHITLYFDSTKNMRTQSLHSMAFKTVHRTFKGATTLFVAVSLAMILELIWILRTPS